MGRPVKGGSGARTTIVGESRGKHGDPARVDEALESLAERLVRSRLVTRRKGPIWFDISLLQVEIENQNVKTFRIGVTPR
jgi:hypothetical protein